jgi:hypothetical protein
MDLESRFTKKSTDVSVNFLVNQFLAILKCYRCREELSILVGFDHVCFETQCGENPIGLGIKI